MKDNKPELFWLENNRNSAILTQKNGNKIELSKGDMITFHYDYLIIAKILGFTFNGPYSQPNGILFTEYRNGEWDPWSMRKKKLNIYFQYETWNTVKKIFIDPPLPASYN